MRREFMDDRLLNSKTEPGLDTAPETTPLGEVPMVREDCWREIHRLFQVERYSKAEIARRLDLDRKTVRAILREAVWRPYRRRAERTDVGEGRDLAIVTVPQGWPAAK